MSGFVFPLPKAFSGGSGSWTVDQGVDISAPGHTPLLAVGDGTIVGHGIGGFGPDAPILKLDQPINGQSYVYYGHAGPGNKVAVGTHVTAGTQIGEVGAGIVGISTGPHLEIGFSDVRGSPVGPKGNPSAHLMQSLLSGSTSSALTAAQNKLTPGNTNIGALPGAALGVLGAGASAVAGAGTDIVMAGFNALFDSIVSHAKYAALAFVAIIGGFVLMARGTSRVSHAQPTPA